MPKTILLRRDEDVAGRVLRFDFTVSVDVRVDEDVLEGADTITLAEVEASLVGSKIEDSDRLFAALMSYGYEKFVRDHVVTVAGVQAALGLTAADSEPRFERDWERRTREAGAPFSWLTWVDLPAAPTLPREEEPTTSGGSGPLYDDDVIERDPAEVRRQL